MADPTLHPQPKRHDSMPASALQIIHRGSAGGPALTKEQKRFNQLVGKIKAIRAKIEHFKEVDQDLRDLGQKMILPAEEKFTRALRDLVLAMHASPHKLKLTRRQHQKFLQVMNAEITMLLKTSFLAEDAQLRRLFGVYSESGMSYEEMEAASARQAQEEAARIFGMDVEDMDDPEKVEELLKQRADAEREAENEESEAPKKSKAQLDAESKRNAAENAVKKTTRQIYLDLVKHCHPDREQDEVKRAEKTEWMKQITSAYEVDDHLRLLEMQMTLLTERENAFADFTASELKYFNESLQRQFTNLEDEMMMSHPLHTGNMFGRLFHPNRSIMLRELEVEQNSLKHRTHAVGLNAQLITSEQGFRRYVTDYHLPSLHEQEDVDFGDIFR
jgi:cytochrome c5